MKIKCCLGTFLLFSSCIFAQLPNCDVWLFDYSVQIGNYTFANGKNISNHPGYDNQPSFDFDGCTLLLTSERDSGQTEIFWYSIPSSSHFPLTGHTEANEYSSEMQQLTYTRVSEYSPQTQPGRNDNLLTAVVVEKDSTQRFYAYDAILAKPFTRTKSKFIPRVLLPNVKNVAYARWYNDSIVFLCILPEPMALFEANVNTQAISKCAVNAGRSMSVYHEKNRDLFLYSQMKPDSTYEIDALDGSGKTISDFKPVPFLKGSQDFTVDNNGNIFMAAGTKLFIWTIGKSEAWKEINDFAPQGLHRITRLAVSPDGKHFSLVDNT